MPWGADDARWRGPARSPQDGRCSAMRCPMCHDPLAAMPLEDGATADTCARCRVAFLSSEALRSPTDAEPLAGGGGLPEGGEGWSCPACEVVLMEPSRLRGVAVSRCPYCAGVIARLGDLPALLATAPRPRRGHARMPAPASPPRPTLRGWIELGALPLALGGAWVLQGSGLARLVLGGARIPLHELGHALMGWLCGYSAVPIPFGMTYRSAERSWGAWALVAAGLGALGWRLWRRRSTALAALCGVALAAQTGCTWATTRATRELLFTFGGSAGELVLSAALLGMFHLALPARWRWDRARWIALLVAAFILVEQTLRWRGARLDHGLIPWGSVMGADGDMQRLMRDHGWAPSRIASRYTLVAHLSLALTAASWLAALARRLSGRGDDEAIDDVD